MKKILLIMVVISLMPLPMFVKDVSAWSAEDERQRQYILELDRQRKSENEYKREQEQAEREHHERMYGGTERFMEDLRRARESWDQNE